jgi:hypothetical protein
MMPPAFTLVTSRLSVAIDAPGTAYRGPRFDWTTQVRQVTLDGRLTFLTQERDDNQWPEYQGRGLAGEFGIETPLGYDTCPVGGQFPKVGVGLLTRSDDKPYHFFRPYPIDPARFTADQAAPSSLRFTADQPVHRGWGWTLVRTWTAQGTDLSLETSLTNTGTEVLETEEYLHNFLNLGRGTVGPSWVLTRPGDWDPPTLFENVDPEGLLVLQGSQVTWTRTPTTSFFLADRRHPAPATWTLTDTATGQRVSERTDFSPDRFHVWGVGHVVSPELYRRVRVAPGETQTWTRTWSFSTEADDGR